MCDCVCPYDPTLATHSMISPSVHVLTQCSVMTNRWIMTTYLSCQPQPQPELGGDGSLRRNEPKKKITPPPFSLSLFPSLASSPCLPLCRFQLSRSSATVPGARERSQHIADAARSISERHIQRQLPASKSKKKTNHTTCKSLQHQIRNRQIIWSSLCSLSATSIGTST